MTLIERLESFNEYMETAEARQIRKDAAEEIRRLSYSLESARMLLQEYETKTRVLGEMNCKTKY